MTKPPICSGVKNPAFAFFLMEEFPLLGLYVGACLLRAFFKPALNLPRQQPAKPDCFDRNAVLLRSIASLKNRRNT
jgi:hypothetical protein